MELIIHADQSELLSPNGESVVFEEGVQSDNARKRQAKLKEELPHLIYETIEKVFSDEAVISIDIDNFDFLTKLVDEVTSEAGRAILALSITQAGIKVITPEQSIRLHKGSRNSKAFGWVEGVSMRVLSASVSSILREEELLRINKDGPMMTRSLAENYPYSPLYKAALRGAKREWVQFIEEIEEDRLDSSAALEYILLSLVRRSEKFEEIASSLLNALSKYINQSDSRSPLETRNLISEHIDKSLHSARLFEIAVHSLYQALDDLGELEYELLPLGQMRSADLKAGKIGDVELGKQNKEKSLPSISWDMKYGKPNLGQELTELAIKLKGDHNLQRFGFITNGEPELSQNILDSVDSLSKNSGVSIEIISFDEWVREIFSKFKSEELLCDQWLIAYSETLAQLRRDKAPVDEPTGAWIMSLESILLEAIR